VALLGWRSFSGKEPWGPCFSLICHISAAIFALMKK